MFSELITGLRRHAFLRIWEPTLEFVECYNDNRVCGFAELVEFENYFWIARLLAIDV